MFPLSSQTNVNSAGTLATTVVVFESILRSSTFVVAKSKEESTHINLLLATTIASTFAVTQATAVPLEEFGSIVL
jgi:hypothetical protein